MLLLLILVLSSSLLEEYNSYPPPELVRSNLGSADPSLSSPLRVIPLLDPIELTKNELFFFTNYFLLLSSSLLLSCFLAYFLTRPLREKLLMCSLQKMTERKSSRKTLTPKRFIPEEEEKKEKELSGGQKSGGSKVRLISYYSF